MFNCLFLITLGIALVLFFLLVIHFKKQLNDNEHTKEKMLIVCNVLAKEMDGIKRELHEIKKTTSVGKNKYSSHTNTIEGEVVDMADKEENMEVEVEVEEGGADVLKIKRKDHGHSDNDNDNDSSDSEREEISFSYSEDEGETDEEEEKGGEEEEEEEEEEEKEDEEEEDEEEAFMAECRRIEMEEKENEIRKQSVKSSIETMPEKEEEDEEEEDDDDEDDEEIEPLNLDDDVAMLKSRWITERDQVSIFASSLFFSDCSSASKILSPILFPIGS